MDEAEYCDRIAIMDRGKIVALDTPEALKASVGTDRIQIHTGDDDAAIAALRERFEIEAVVAEGAVTFGVPDGEQFVPRLFTELGEPIRSVHVSRPSLDDVFMSYTGTTIRDANIGRDDRHAAQHGPGAHDEPLMATESVTVPSAPDAVARPGGSRVGKVHVPTRSIGSELRAIRVVWRRELIRFSRDRLRIITSLVQPFLFLFVLGTGLSSSGLGRDARGQLQNLHLPRRAVHGGHVHRDVLRRLDRVGPGVRLPARDDGRARAAQLDRAGQVPRRCHRGHLPGPDRDRDPAAR